MNKKLLINLNRMLDNPPVFLKVLRGWAVLSFVVFGLFGIYPQAKTLLKSVETYSEMQKINKSLKEKTDLIRSESLKVEKNQRGVTALNTYLPDDYEVQNYIVDLSFATAQTGYTLTGFRVDWPTDYSPEVKAYADLNGMGKFKELITTIESLKRVSQVNDLRFSNQNDDKSVLLQIEIFILK